MPWGTVTLKVIACAAIATMSNAIIAIFLLIYL